MFEPFFTNFPDYSIVESPTKELIAQYQGKLPDELLQLWQSHGLGVYMNGYIRLVNPNDFMEFVNESVNLYVEGTIPIATTAFGDIVLWEKDRVKLVLYRYGISEVVASDELDFWMDFLLPDSDYRKEEMKDSLYAEAKDKLGEPAFDECFGYVPALVLGGSEKVENLQRLKMAEHLMIVSEFTGVIE